MARMIDASRFGEILEQWKKDCLEDNDIQGAEMISDVILQLDDMPTPTPPNEPLTLEELREMDGEPVWVEELNCWALVYIFVIKGIEIPFALFDDGCIETFNISCKDLHCYLRPPEGEEEP